jgi:hypothetical protein
MFEYRVAFSNNRRYVRYKASHPAHDAPGRVPSAGCENPVEEFAAQFRITKRVKEKDMSAISVGSFGGYGVGTGTAPARHSHLRMTKRGRAVLLTIVATPLVLVAVAFGINAGGATATSSSTPLAKVTVVGGETLWAVAEQIAPRSDPRDVIADLESVNRLSSANIYPGEQLLIPAQYSK